MKNSLPLWLSAAALLAPALGQTSTKCDPTKVTCPPNRALSSSVTYDFTKGLPSSSDMPVDGHVPFDSNGASLTASMSSNATTFTSNWYMMFGYVEVTLKAAKGKGLVSAVALLSDDLDEIDWEMVGPESQTGWTNYFGKGCAGPDHGNCGYNRGKRVAAPNNQDQFHTYKVDWTPDQITWWIDDDKANARVLKQADAEKAPDGRPEWPQTPMKLSVGVWATSVGSNPWNGGPATFTDGPNVMQIKSIKATDYSTGKFYSYGDKSGNWKSITSNGGSINSNLSSSSQTGKDSSSSSSSSSPSSSNSTSSGYTGSASTNSTSTGSGSTGSGSNGSGSTGSGSTGSGSSNPANTNPNAPIHTGASASLRVQQAAAGLIGLVALAPLLF